MSKIFLKLFSIIETHWTFSSLRIRNFMSLVYRIFLVLITISCLFFLIAVKFFNVAQLNTYTSTDWDGLRQLFYSSKEIRLFPVSTSIPYMLQNYWTYSTKERKPHTLVLKQFHQFEIQPQKRPVSRTRQIGFEPVDVDIAQSFTTLSWWPP